MRTCLILTLVLGGCASKTDDPSPSPLLFLKVRLQPTRYVRVTWNEEDWTLIRGLGPLHHPDEFNRLLEGERYSPTRDWFTLYQGTRPRFIFEEKPKELRIMALTEPSSGSNDQPPVYREFAQLPLPLQPGLTWESRRGGPKGETREKASCRAEGIEAHDGAHDALRVDFTESGEIRTSMWFDRTGGLLRWHGILPADVELAPGSALPFQLGIVAESYSNLGRVDDVRRWAPEMCAGPPEPPLRTSASRDTDTHGRKQYYLYALDRDAYLQAGKRDQPDGQILVKESWYPPASRRGQLRSKGAKGPLFIMVKQDGDWTYATASPDGETIIASGKLASCRGCHESERTRDRMFGLPSAKAVGMQEE